MKALLIHLSITMFASSCLAFVQPGTIPVGAMDVTNNRKAIACPGPSPFSNTRGDCHAVIGRQRQSVSKVSTMGLFGLGIPEVAIICVAAAFVLGPETIGNLIGQAKGGFDELPEDIKKIPEEFQKGVEEGESNARARKAKLMEEAPPDDSQD